MSDLGNKQIMAENIKYYMKKKSIDRKKLCADLNISYTTVSSWLQADSYPRIDKIEMMANYFGIDKSQLVEKHDVLKKKESEINPDPTFADLGMPYGGKIPDELKQTYADLAESYFKRHPEMLNKNNK